MKFIHIADIHANKARKDIVLHILNEIVKLCREDKDIRFVLFAGDFWDFTITATEASGFSEIVRAFNTMQSLIPCYMIYGTAYHEPDGSLEVFRIMNNVTVYERQGVDYLNYDGKTIALLTIPEPRLQKVKGVSFEEKYKNVQQSFISVFGELRQEVKANSPDYIIGLYHGNIEGAELQNGQPVPSGETTLSKSLIQSVTFDYFACGHIHKPQHIAGTECYYAGSPCPKDFGETHNGCFKIIEL